MSRVSRAVRERSFTAGDPSPGRALPGTIRHREMCLISVDGGFDAACPLDAGVQARCVCRSPHPRRIAGRSPA